MLLAVQFVPVPAMTATRPPATSTAMRTSRSRSAIVRVGASPVVPQGTSPSAPSSTCHAAKSAKAFSSTSSLANGVASATMEPPIMNRSQCAARRSIGLCRILGKAKGFNSRSSPSEPQLDRLSEDAHRVWATAGLECGVVDGCFAGREKPTSQTMRLEGYPMAFMVLSDHKGGLMGDLGRGRCDSPIGMAEHGTLQSARSGKWTAPVNSNYRIKKRDGSKRREIKSS